MKSNRALRNITYDEFKAYVVINVDMFSDESRVRLNHTFKVCENTLDESEKKRRLYDVLYRHCLWDVEEAKEEGFIMFLERELKEAKDMFSYYKNNKGWKFLCTVAQGHLSNITISTKIGTIELKSKELEIMGKIGFLLSPDINDNVFLHQLPENLQNVLKAEVEFDMERLV